MTVTQHTGSDLLGIVFYFDGLHSWTRGLQLLTIGRAVRLTLSLHLLHRQTFRRHVLHRRVLPHVISIAFQRQVRHHLTTFRVALVVFGRAITLH